MTQAEKNLEAGKILVGATDQIGDMLQRNYNEGTAVQKATAVLSALQCDLFASFVILQPNRGPIVSRSIILRTILENHGTMIHIRDNEKRANSYLESVVRFDLQLTEAAELKRSVVKVEWTSSVIKDRVAKIDSNSSFIYDLLSNFTHGNNIIDLLPPDPPDEGADSYEALIENYFLSEYVQLLFIIVHELDMDDKLRDVLYDAMESASTMALGEPSTWKAV